ncbi:MAG: outer membrane lipoprotein-sorting protein [Alphaproteobacteria bacterium]|nr:MAG: outer membrane lipoprotein-sorting protein [Alphaproteobacteria bacterium]
MIKEAFDWITLNPWKIISVGIIAMVAFGSGLPQLYKDTSPDAYIEPGNPALIYRDKVKDTFGLNDPFVVAIEAPEGKTIYNLETLTLIADLTDIVMDTPNIDYDRVTSLTTEQIIAGHDDEINITPAYEYAPETQEEVVEIQRRVQAFPIFHGNLVARDGTMTLIVGEMINADDSKETFIALSAAVLAASANYPGKVHVAGEAATAGYLDDYISQDARRAFPLVALFIVFILAIAFRSTSGVLLPFAVVLATAAITMGIRAMMGVPFYAITNALIVVLAAISVADAIHIISEYRDELGAGGHKTPREALVSAMTRMFNPVAVTSITTVAGFVGIWLGSDMPPMQAFGLFAGLGVIVAWLYSITFMPAVLAYMHRNKTVDEVWAKGRAKERKLLGQILRGLAEVVVHFPKQAMALSIGFLAVCLFASTLVEVDYSRIRNFAADEDVRVADTAINLAMDGTYRLQVVVDANEPEGIFRPDTMRRIEALQRFALTLPLVEGVTSIVDTLKEVNKGLSGGDPTQLKLPDDGDAIAQLFLAYESLGDPADLEDDIDFDHQQILVKLRTKANSYKTSMPIIIALEDYLETTFNSPDVTGKLSGRVYLNYHWLKSIEANHLTSVAIAVVLALLVAGLVFRSAVAAFFCLYHVVFAVFMVYAVMGVLGIGLGVTTSMFAAITIGLGVDFSVHSIERVRMLATARGEVNGDVIRDSFQSTGRALWFNLWALCLGFSALLISNNPTVSEFAGLLIVAIAANFIASMTALPAALLVMKPNFLINRKIDFTKGIQLSGIPSGNFGIFVAAGLALTIAFFSTDGQAQSDLTTELTADQIVEKVNQRDEGEHLTRDIKMILTDRKDRVRVRLAKGYRLDTTGERRALIAFKEPSNIKDTAFLTYDYHEVGKVDQQWLYLPKLRKSRRVSGAERGEYFLGTDFTFEDLKMEGRISAVDYNFTLVEDPEAEANSITVEGIPISTAVSRELGYGRIRVDVDPTNWMILSYRMLGVKGKPLKQLHFLDVQQVDGIWTIGVIDVENFKTRHKTRFEFSNISFTTPVNEALMDQRNLSRVGR